MAGITDFLKEKQQFSFLKEIFEYCGERRGAPCLSMTGSQAFLGNML
jgi:hypothetical protein